MGCGCALLVVALGVFWVRNAATDELSLRPLLISPRLHLSTAGIRRPADNKKLEHVLGGSPRAEATFAAGLGYSWAGTGQNGLVRVLGQVTFFVSPGPFFLKRAVELSKPATLSALRKRPGAHLSARGRHTASSHQTLKRSNGPATVLFSALAEAPAAARSNRNRPCRLLGVIHACIAMFYHKLTDQKLTKELMGKPGRQTEGRTETRKSDSATHPTPEIAKNDNISQRRQTAPPHGVE